VLADPKQYDSVWNQYVTEFKKLNPSVYEDKMTQLIKEKIQKVTGSSN